MDGVRWAARIGYRRGPCRSSSRACWTPGRSARWRIPCARSALPCRDCEWSPVQRVADGPEVFDELLTLVVGVQRQELLALFVGDDVDDVLVEPLFVLFGELGSLGGCAPGAASTPTTRWRTKCDACCYFYCLTRKRGGPKTSPEWIVSFRPRTRSESRDGPRTDSDKDFGNPGDPASGSPDLFSPGLLLTS